MTLLVSCKVSNMTCGKLINYSVEISYDTIPKNNIGVLSKSPTEDLLISDTIYTVTLRFNKANTKYRVTNNVYNVLDRKKLNKNLCLTEEEILLF